MAAYQDWQALSDQQKKITANPLLTATRGAEVTAIRSGTADSGSGMYPWQKNPGVQSQPTVSGGGVSTSSTPTAGMTGSATSPSPTSGSTGLLSQPSTLSFNQSSATSGINPVTRTVAPDELASYHLDALLGKDSPLAQRAKTAGAQYANSRGLLNSSMGAEAAYGAWVDRATPIATADASRYGQVADKNQDAENTFRLADKNFNFDMTLQQNEQAWRSGENTKDRSLTASEGAADRSSRLQLTQMGIDADDRRFDKDIAFRGTEAALDRDFTLGRDATQNQFVSGENQLNREFDRDTQMQAAEIDAQARLTQHLYSLEELGYRFNLDQMNIPKTYAANVMGELSQGINAILADPNMDEAAKKNAIDNRVAVTNDMLKFGSTVYNTPLPSFGAAA
jgi:hypothetical protein